MSMVKSMSSPSTSFRDLFLSPVSFERCQYLTFWWFKCYLPPVSPHLILFVQVQACTCHINISYWAYLTEQGGIVCISSPTPETNLWKYVDNVSISECLPKNGGRSIRSSIDFISSRASMNLAGFPQVVRQLFAYVCVSLKSPLSYPVYELMVK